MKKTLLLLFCLCSALIMQAQTKTTGVVSLMTGMTAQLQLNNTTSTATLTLTGPSDRWFALQIGSFAAGGGMQSGMDVVYYDGTTLVDAVHNGVGSTPTIDAVNNWTSTVSTSGGTTTIVATRPFNTGSAQDYTFVYSDTSIDFAYARMSSASFGLAYHGTNRGYALNNTFSCVAPAAPTASAQSFCSGATVANLTATGATGATFSWYNVPTGGSPLATGTALVSGNYYVSQTVDACESTRTTVAVTVTTVSAPTASAQTLCAGATVSNLTATGAAGATFSWYSAPTGGTALAGTTALSTGNYYVSQTVGVCESTRTTVAVTISDPANPTASAQSLCSGATVANLTATGTAGATFNWYAAPTGGTALAAGTVLSSGNYYVSQTVGACESDRTTVAVTINSVALPTASAQSFCSGATVANLAATGAAGATFSWYTAPTGGTALSAGTALTSGNYYVSQTVGSCESARAAVAVTVTTVPVPSAAVQAFCTGAMVSELVATGNAGATINWYANATGGAPLSATTLLATGNYYVSQTVGSCESQRAAVSVTVTEATEPTAIDQAVCEGASVQELIVNGVPGATFNWYLDATGGTALANDAEVVAGTYYVSQSLGTCESERTMIAVTINPVPDAPTGEPIQQFTEGETVSTLEITTEAGATVNWYMMNLLGDIVEVELTDELVDDGVYFATQTLNGCESENLIITAQEVLSTASFTVAGAVAYPNPVKDMLTISSKNNINGIEVYNLIGQQVLYLETSGETVTVDTSKLNSGTYIVKVNAADTESVLRIIKN